MTDHGEIHGDDCAHRVTQEDWDTDWEAEKRTPEFIIEGTFLESLTRRLPLEKFSWGNCPAMDLLELPYNEGGGSDRDLKLLSGMPIPSRKMPQNFPDQHLQSEVTYGMAYRPWRGFHRPSMAR